MPLPCLCVELLAGMAVRLAGAADGCTMASRGLLAGVASAHRFRAFPFTGCADMRSALALLLRGPALGFLLLGAAKVAAIALRAVVLRGACFPQRDIDRLPAAPDLARLAATAALQFAVLELVHHPSSDALLTR